MSKLCAGCGSSLSRWVLLCKVGRELIKLSALKGAKIAFEEGEVIEVVVSDMESEFRTRFEGFLAMRASELEIFVLMDGLPVLNGC